MLNLTSLKAGRIYSFIHKGEVETVAYRNGTNGREHAPEWLKLASITRIASFKGNCACPDSYARAMVRREGEYEPKQAPWFAWETRNGIVSHKKTGALYLALLNPEPIKTTYYVNGVEATAEQEKEIKEWKKGSKEFDIFALFALDKVECKGVID
jgi:hypothetical protein